MFLPSGSEAKTSIWKTEGQKETRKERNGENKNREKRKTNDLDIDELVNTKYLHNY